MNGNVVMKNVIGLVRVSTDLQTEKHGGTSIEFQKNKLVQYAELNDMDLTNVIVDVASGGLESRDGIEQLKSHIENGEVDVVLVWNVSRCFRSMIYFAKFYEYLKSNDVELISVSEGIRSSRKEGEMLFGIMASISSYEKEIINERLHNGRLMKARKGIRGFGSKLPFGYKRNTSGEVEINEREAPIVRYIFKKVNQLKSSKMSPTKRTRHLIKLLNKKGYKLNGHSVKGWNIRDMIGNSFYCGEITYSGTKTKGIHPPIISKRLFNQIQMN